MKLKSIALAVITMCLHAAGAHAYVVKQSSLERPLLFKMFQTSSAIPYTTTSTGYALPTVMISKNGAVFAAPAGAVTVVGNGWFQVAANATDDNTLGVLTLYATAPSADESDTLFEVAAYDPQDIALLGLTGVATVANQTTELTQVNKIGLNTGDSPNAVTAQTNTATAVTQTTPANLGTAVWTTPTTRTVTGGTVTASNFVAAPTVAQVAAGILTTPANLLATNATGQVSASNLPADYLSSAEQTTLNGAATVPGVWNAVSASYVVAGSEGAKLAAAGSAGDPWATLTANETTAGSFGVLMNTNLNATVGGVPAATATALMTRPIKAGLTFGQLLVGLEAADTKVAAIANTWNATTHILTTAYQFTGDAGAVLTTNTQYPTTQTSAPAVSGITTTVGTISQP